jgi:hypothetical protein
MRSTQRLLTTLLAAAISVAAPACSNDPGTSGAGGSGGSRGEAVLTDLHASVVRSYLHMPPNVAMGGYQRTDDYDFDELQTDARLVDFFFNARGLLQRLSLKALLLENGLRRVIMLRLPLIFPTDLMRDQIIENVEAATGEDIRHELFLGATHTHHAPARFLEAPDIFGLVALDSFQQAIFIQLTDELTRVVLEAMDAERVPVTFSHGANDAFDPDGRVNRDRRSEDDNLYFHQNGLLCPLEDNACQAAGEPVGKDPRLHLVRLDRTDGTPFALIANLPVHGTVLGDENPYMSEDAPGLIEAKTEELFATEDDLGEVTVLMMQGTAGNVSPGNSEVGHGGTQRLEAVGIAAAERIADLYRSLPEGEARIDIEYFANRFPIDRDLIGYGPGEFANGDSVYTRGAFLCGVDYDEDDGVPETRMDSGQVFCQVDVAGVEDLVGETITTFDKTVVSVMRLGDLIVLGLPGEATTPLGMDLHRRLSERYGIGRERSVIYAYANDHQFYIMLEDDWLQGGYETSVNIWGPKFGSYLNGVVEDLVEPATTPELEDPAAYDDLPEWDHVNWRELRLQDTGFELYTTPNAGNTISQPADVERLELVTFTWEGGDPMVDLPSVWLEVDSGPGGFVPVTRVDGTAMSDEGYELLLLHEQDGERCEWAATYEFLAYEAEGSYRFAYWGERHAGDGTEMYGSAGSPLYSDTFTLSARTSLELIDAAASGTTVTITIGYPLVEGAYRLRAYDHRQDAADPLSGGTATVTATIEGGDQVFEDIPISENGTATVELGSPVAVEQLVMLTIEATDPYGNATVPPITTVVTAQ